MRYAKQGMTSLKTKKTVLISNEQEKQIKEAFLK